MLHLTSTGNEYMKFPRMRHINLPITSKSIIGIHRREKKRNAPVDIVEPVTKGMMFFAILAQGRQTSRTP